MTSPKEDGMNSKTKTTDLKHGPVGDSIKDFLYDTLCHTYVPELELREISIDHAAGLVIKDYLKSCGKG